MFYNEVDLFGRLMNALKLCICAVVCTVAVRAVVDVGRAVEFSITSSCLNKGGSQRRSLTLPLAIAP